MAAKLEVRMVRYSSLQDSFIPYYMPGLIPAHAHQRHNWTVATLEICDFDTDRQSVGKRSDFLCAQHLFNNLPG